MTITEVENIVINLQEEIAARDAVIHGLQTELSKLQQDFDDYRSSIDTLLTEVVKTAENNSQRIATQQAPPPPGSVKNNGMAAPTAMTQAEG